MSPELFETIRAIVLFVILLFFAFVGLQFLLMRERRHRKPTGKATGAGAATFGISGMGASDAAASGFEASSGETSGESGSGGESGGGDFSGGGGEGGGGGASGSWS